MAVNGGLRSIAPNSEGVRIQDADAMARKKEKEISFAPKANGSLEIAKRFARMSTPRVTCVDIYGT